MIKRYDGKLSHIENASYVSYEDYAALQQKLDAMAAENAVLKSVFDTVTDLSNEPEFHYQGMGCGLEDRGIIDRYEAMKYGWDEAIERIYGEVIPSAEEVLFPATDAYLNSVRAEGLKMAIDHMSNQTSDDCADVTVLPVMDMYKKLRSGTHDIADKAG